MGTESESNLDDDQLADLEDAVAEAQHLLETAIDECDPNLFREATDMLEEAMDALEAYLADNEDG